MKFRRPAIVIVALLAATAVFFAGRRHMQEAATESAWRSQQERFFKERRDLGFAGDGGDGDDLGARTWVTRWEALGDDNGTSSVRERTDTCPSCHLGVDDARLVSASLPREFRAHPHSETLLGMHPPKAFGCTSCHQGDGSWSKPHPQWVVRETEKGRTWALDADDDTPSREPMLRMGKLVRTRIDGDNDQMEVQLGTSAWRKVVLGDGAPREIEKEEELWVTIEAAMRAALAPDSGEKVHPFFRKVGGHVTIGVEGDDTAKLGVRFPKPALAEMLGFSDEALAGKAEYVAPRRPSAPMRADGQESWGEHGVYTPPWGALGLQIAPEFRDRFLLALPEVEAGCFRCHTRETTLAPRNHEGSTPVPVFTEGRALYRQLGCANCHATARMPNVKRTGPPLESVTAKATPAWILGFLRDPRAWSPRTTMPNHWPVPLDPKTKKAEPSGSPAYDAWLAQREAETLSIVAWLVERGEALPGSKWARGHDGKRKLADDIARQANVPGASAEDGKAIFDAYGCRGCHATTEHDLPEPLRHRERDAAPSLARAGSKLSEDWTAYWVMDPARAWHGASMPSLRLDRREAASVAKYIATLRAPVLPERANKRPTADEALILATNERRTELVPCNVEGSPTMPRAQCGEALAHKYGCNGCHDDGALDAEAGKKVGPALDGWSTRPSSSLDFGDAIVDSSEQTRETFAAWKLDAPHLFRRTDGPEPKMPDYDLSAREIRALMVFLAGLTNVRPRAELDPASNAGHAAMLDGAQLVHDANCRGCHVIEDDGTHREPAMVVTHEPHLDPRLAPPHLVAEGARVQPSWLFAFLDRPDQHGVRPALHPEWVYGNLAPPNRMAVRMPTFAFGTPETTAIVRYFAARDGAEYPYAPPVVKKLTSDEKLVALLSINESGCMKCHFAGEFPIERGKVALADLAPNLGAVSQRLTPTWVEKFLTAPATFAFKTPMPPFAKDPAGDAILLKLPPGYLRPKSAEAQIALVRDLLFVLREKSQLPARGEELRSPLLGLGD